MHSNPLSQLASVEKEGHNNSRYSHKKTLSTFVLTYVIAASAFMCQIVARIHKNKGILFYNQLRTSHIR